MKLLGTRSSGKNVVFIRHLYHTEAACPIFGKGATKTGEPARPRVGSEAIPLRFWLRLCRAALYRGFPNPQAVGRPRPCRLGSRRHSRFGNLYSLSGVVHRLRWSPPIRSTAQTVNNAVAMPAANLSFQAQPPQGKLGFGSGTNRKPARSTSLAQLFDRSRNPNADTHSQVPTSNVSPYTACAPRSNKT